MRTAWYIAKKDLLQVFRDRASFIILLAVPLILILTVGFAHGSLFGNDSSKIAIKVAVSNQDSGYVGKAIVDALNAAINEGMKHVSGEIVLFTDVRQPLERKRSRLASHRGARAYA